MITIVSGNTFSYNNMTYFWIKVVRRRWLVTKKSPGLQNTATPHLQILCVLVKLIYTLTQRSTVY